MINISGKIKWVEVYPTSRIKKSIFSFEILSFQVLKSVNIFKLTSFFNL